MIPFSSILFFYFLDYNIFRWKSFGHTPTLSVTYRVPELPRIFHLGLLCFRFRGVTRKKAKYGKGENFQRAELI